MLLNLKDKEKQFKLVYRNKLYKSAWSYNCLEMLKEYEEGAKKLDIKGENVFHGYMEFY